MVRSQSHRDPTVTWWGHSHTEIPQSHGEVTVTQRSHSHMVRSQSHRDPTVTWWGHSHIEIPQSHGEVTVTQRSQSHSEVTVTQTPPLSMSPLSYHVKPSQTQVKPRSRPGSQNGADIMGRIIHTNGKLGVYHTQRWQSHTHPIVKQTPVTEKAQSHRVTKSITGTSSTVTEITVYSFRQQRRCC